jgi:EmrB/QacA subfamily drug resistance transporter
MTTVAAPRPASRLGPVVQYALLAGPLLSMLDSSVVNVAVEPIARQLHASLPVAQWTVSGYLLALGAGLAATAYLARQLGTIALYRGSIAAFTAASAACAFAPTMQVLLLTRAIQGLVAAPLVPMAMSMLFGKGESARSMPATAGMLLFLGPALGPSVGGALIAAGGWRGIFLINLPTGLAAAFAVRKIPPGLAPGAGERIRLDVPGLVLLAAGMMLLLLGITDAGTDGWGAPASWLTMLAGAGALACYAARARKVEQPVLNLGLARSRGGIVALTLCATASIVTFSVIFLLPVFVQSVQGHSALAAGIAMLPQGIVTGLSTILGQRALSHVTVRTMVLTGFALLTVASLGLAKIGAQTPLPVIAALLAGRAVAIGLVISPLLAMLTGSVGPAEMGDASTLFSIWQRIAGSLGVGLIAAVFASQSAAHGPVRGLHVTAIVITAIAAAGLLAAPLIPAERAAGIYG